MRLNRPFLLALAVTLAAAACGGGDAGEGSGDGGASGGTSTPTPSSTASPSADDGKLDCALDNSGVFVRTCTVEQKTVDSKKTLVVRHPDGAFRRFAIVTDGRGVIPADGAQSGAATVGNGVIELKVDNDRYQFPATIANAGS